MSAVISLLTENESGSAADTGSAVHLAAHAWHGGAEKNTAIALEVMRRMKHKFPLADLGSAEQQFRLYAKDIRNVEAVIVLSEKETVLELPPPPGHSTPVFIQGTLDQVRRERGGLVLVDLKTGGKHEGPAMLAYHCVQLCAYQVMATKVLGEVVRRAKIIRTKDYMKSRPGPAHWEAPWSYDDALAILDEVRLRVGDIRSGRISITPSQEQCEYCPAGGMQNCIRRRESL